MDLIQKVRNRERLTQEEGEALYDLDLYTLGELADGIRREKYGNKSYFNINRHVSAHNPNDGVEWFESGVDSMPGGGAEIFDEGVREYLCKGKVTSDQWLEIHEKWHQRGRESNATMLFGHVETRAHRIDHMIRLRDLQDRTGGFNAFIPLVYQRDNNFLKVKEFPSGQEILKTYAISRIMLDNIPHIKAYWVTASINLALIAQEFGGAASAQGMELHDFVAMIKNSGFQPVERDSLYNELKVY